eukprot:TRINITY_DN3679_c0_g1_i1.p1 TRINITY_DN3679_c0_g1~~TRINITY_DN3679_c0_g1_i1.p1  ORF type:complete len:358 (+),score=86.18 TRINITY_DN3679_c0_g1_i1:46-1119(+)
MLVTGRSDYLNSDSEASSLLLWETIEGGRKLEPVSEVDGPKNPSWVEFADNVMVCTGETDAGGCIFSYHLKDGKFIKKSTCPVPGAPCHILLSQQCAVVATYLGGNVTAVPFDSEGNLKQEDMFVLDVSEPVRTPQISFRQEKSHPHEVHLIREGLLAVPDLGLDCVHIIKQTGPKLTLMSKVVCQPGGGPRHVEVCLSNKVLYVLNELLSTISVFSFEFDDEEGIKTTEIETAVQLLPEGVPGTDAHHRGASEICFSPCGKYLLAATRTTNEIVVFVVGSDGKLNPFSRSFSGGTTPRHFFFHNNLVYASCHIVSDTLHPEKQDTDKVAIFEFENGVLKQLASCSCKFASCTAVVA